MRTVPRRTAALAAAALLALAPLTLAVLPADAAPQQAGDATLTGIRVGEHPGYDRIVLDLTGPRPAVADRFVPALTADGSGLPVTLPCGVANEKWVLVTARPAAAHDGGGRATYRGPAAFCTPALHNVRAVGLTGDFEGVLSVGFGLRHASWVHVFTLASPTRVVIDVGR